MDIVIRATVMFAIVYLLLRLMGKRELGQMTPFEFIALVVTGDLIQQGVTQTDFSLTGAVLAIVTFAFWSLVMTWISYLWPRAEKALEGEPRVLIRDGKLLVANLRGDRLTKSEVESAMRVSGIASIADVAWAMLEPDGQMSFIRKSDLKGGSDGGTPQGG